MRKRYQAFGAKFIHALVVRIRTFSCHFLFAHIHFLNMHAAILIPGVCFPVWLLSSSIVDLLLLLLLLLLLVVVVFVLLWQSFRCVWSTILLVSPPFLTSDV